MLRETVTEGYSLVQPFFDLNKLRSKNSKKMSSMFLLGSFYPINHHQTSTAAKHNSSYVNALLKYF